MHRQPRGSRVPGRKMTVACTDAWPAWLLRVCRVEHHRPRLGNEAGRRGLSVGPGDGVQYSITTIDWCVEAR